MKLWISIKIRDQDEENLNEELKEDNNIKEIEEEEEIDNSLSSEEEDQDNDNNIFNLALKKKKKGKFSHTDFNIINDEDDLKNLNKKKIKNN